MLTCFIATYQHDLIALAHDDQTTQKPYDAQRISPNSTTGDNAVTIGDVELVKATAAAMALVLNMDIYATIDTAKCSVDFSAENQCLGSSNRLPEDESNQGHRVWLEKCVTVAVNCFYSSSSRTVDTWAHKMRHVNFYEILNNQSDQVRFVEWTGVKPQYCSQSWDLKKKGIFPASYRDHLDVQYKALGSVPKLNQYIDHGYVAKLEVVNSAAERQALLDAIATLRDHIDYSVAPLMARASREAELADRISRRVFSNTATFYFVTEFTNATATTKTDCLSPEEVLQQYPELQGVAELIKSFSVAGEFKLANRTVRLAAYTR